MNSLRRWLGWGWVALTLAAGSALADSTPTFPARKTITAGESVIEYTEGDEAFAQAFAARVEEVFQPDPAVSTGPIELPLEQLVQQRDEYLGAVCQYLHLAKPTPRMTKAFDDFIKIAERLDSLITQTKTGLRNFQVWRSPDLKARLEAGQIIKGITLRADGTGVDFKFPEESAERGNWFIPVPITSRDTEIGAALVDKKIRESQGFLRVIPQQKTRRMQIQTVFHETVEIGLIENYLASKDRRWFCEGVANYVGYKVIEDKFGAAVARRYYDVEEQVAMYADLRPSIRLEEWAALEVQLKEKHDDRSTRQGMANYAFATEVVFKVAAQHGPKFLPQLLAEVGKTPKKKTSIKTIYRAYLKLYGEDLRRYLPSKN